jgi:hypothetical protein
MEKGTAEEHFIGVDFHKQTTVVTRLRKDGSRVGKTEKYASTPEGLRAFRESCTASDPVAVEATYPWAFFADTFDDFEGEWVPSLTVRAKCPMCGKTNLLKIKEMVKIAAVKCSGNSKEHTTYF